MHRLRIPISTSVTGLPEPGDQVNAQARRLRVAAMDAGVRVQPASVPPATTCRSAPTSIAGEYVTSTMHPDAGQRLMPAPSSAALTPIWVRLVAADLLRQGRARRSPAWLVSAHTTAAAGAPPPDFSWRDIQVESNAAYLYDITVLRRDICSRRRWWLRRKVQRRIMDLVQGTRQQAIIQHLRPGRLPEQPNNLWTTVDSRIPTTAFSSRYQPPQTVGRQ